MNIFSEIFTTDESNSSDYILYNNSTEQKIDFEMFSVCTVTVLLGLPVNSYVIWLIVTGTGNGLAAEFFSLNLAFCEIVVCVETAMSLISVKVKVIWMLVGFLQALALTGRPLFQCLICVERYLAVVHPVTFLKYKPLRYRVICSVIAWVAGLGCGGVGIVTSLLFIFEFYFIFLLAQFFLFLFFQLFCCVAVLRALKQSGPGERGREREEENHTKRKAFYLILISNVSMVAIYITYIILVYFIWNSSENLVFGYVVFILAGLVQPLLFLYRVGKLPFIKYLKKTFYFKNLRILLYHFENSVTHLLPNSGNV